MIARSLAFTAVLCLPLLMATAGDADARRKAARYTCPKGGVMNCMPKKNRAMCSGPYRRWAEKNCRFRTVR